MINPELPNGDTNKIEVDDPWCYSTPEYLILTMSHGKEFLAARKVHEHQLIEEAKARAAGLSQPPKSSG
jgi:hypothetical protein